MMRGILIRLNDQLHFDGLLPKSRCFKNTFKETLFQLADRVMRLFLKCLIILTRTPT
jgi:hypothetical protein